jgi:predicted dehydrogenase
MTIPHPPPETAEPARFAIVGGGWRSEVFLRLAQDLPEQFQVTGLYSRSAEKRESAARRFGADAADSLDALMSKGEPEFVLVAIPWPVAPEVTAEIAARGVAVLEETPPAPDVDAMRRLWGRIGDRDLVQVADQSMYMPSHMARLAIVRDGVIGTPTSVHVSSNHLYHAVSIMRGLLGAGKGCTAVDAREFVSPVVDPISFDGFTGDPSPVDRVTTLAMIDFGNAKSGLYDFTENQWFNPLRGRRLLIRGTRGEILDDRVAHLEDETTVIESRIVRRQTGIDFNLEGFSLDNIAFNGRAVYRNPFAAARQSDEDIAAATLVQAMAMWVRRQGPAPYPLADGLQDHLVGLAIQESARVGVTVKTSEEAWSTAASPFDS